MLIEPLANQEVVKRIRRIASGLDPYRKRIFHQPDGAPLTSHYIEILQISIFPSIYYKKNETPNHTSPSYWKVLRVRGGIINSIIKHLQS